MQPSLFVTYYVTNFSVHAPLKSTPSKSLHHLPNHLINACTWPIVCNVLCYKYPGHSVRGWCAAFGNRGACSRGRRATQSAAFGSNAQRISRRPALLLDPRAICQHARQRRATAASCGSRSMSGCRWQKIRCPESSPACSPAVANDCAPPQLRAQKNRQDDQRLTESGRSVRRTRPPTLRKLLTSSCSRRPLLSSPAVT